MIAGVKIEKVEAEQIEKFGAEAMLKGLGGILVPGGFGERGIEGKILAAQYRPRTKGALPGPLPGHANCHH